MEDRDRFALARWLARAGLDGVAPERLLAGFCERLNAGGVAVVRAAATVQSLDPVVGALVFRWSRAHAAGWREAFERADADFDGEGWHRSPFYALYMSNATRLRRRLTSPEAIAEFPVFADFAREGATDYLAVKSMFAAAGAGEGVLSSWLSDRPDGFTDDELAALEALSPPLDLALYAAALSAGAETLLNTYLGRDAARRVLAGAVERGVAHRLDAVLWASDLQGFTRLADNEPEARVIDLLNAYAEAVVDAIAAAGGEVLKFIGDGVLAVFDRRALADAPTAALEAAERALDATRALSAERAAAGLPVSRLRVALHAGEVFYGNVGARTRLDFTVVGPTVNEAARLCDMCRSLEQELVVSAAFHAIAGPPRARLVGLGRYALRGVGRPQHLFTVERDAC